MSISADFLAELRARLQLSDIVGRTVSFDRRKSNPRKRDFWACCPFHHEKSPSFHVEDDKGRYYCFGCGAKGDAVTFLMETQSMTFREAVESLARDAGLTVPAPTPAAARQEKVRAGLREALEAATVFFEARLGGPDGERARTYLDARGLTPDVRARFRIGYAPAGGQMMQKALAPQGFTADVLARAGLTGQKDPDRPPYDYFRDRVIFPIGDRQGRIIGFGGRVLTPETEPKYLNSPETELFKKGAVLYNLDRARAAMRDAPALIVAEGYVDVIAFDRAGLGAAVAPLGTALTEEQLEEAWRLHAEPVLCFDGDGAGLRAAYRALSLALPMISARRTLRFALLPAGQDPDDLLAGQGPDALRRTIEGAVGVADLLWQRERDAGALDTPERRAGLGARLRDAVDTVADESVRYHLRSDLFARSRAHFRKQRDEAFGGSGVKPGSRASSSRNRWAPPQRTTRELRDSALALVSRNSPKADMAGMAARLLDGSRQVSRAREEEILALALQHPWLLEAEAETLADLVMEDAGCERLRLAILEGLEILEPESENGDTKALDSLRLKGHLSDGVVGPVVARVLRGDLVRAGRATAPNAPTDQVAAAWRETVLRHRTIALCRGELRSAVSAFQEAATLENEERLITVCQQIQELSQGPRPTEVRSP